MPSGGARPGAGRPRGAASVNASNKIVARKLRDLAQEGWEVLADNYPAIMRKAVEVAVGDDKKPPNIAMLRTLVELMVKVAGTEPEGQDSVISTIVGDFIDRVTKGRAADAGSVEGGGPDSGVQPDSGHYPRTESDSAIPRVGDSLRFGGTEQVGNWWGGVR